MHNNHVHNNNLDSGEEEDSVDDIYQDNGNEIATVRSVETIGSAGTATSPLTPP